MSSWFAAESSEPDTLHRYQLPGHMLIPYISRNMALLQTGQNFDPLDVVP